MSSLIQARKNGAKLDKLTVQQRQFVDYLLEDIEFSPSTAARRAGYSQPSTAAHKLLNQKQIKAHLGKELRLRQERSNLVKDDVLHLIATALYLNPLKLFDYTEDGEWVIKDPNSIPDEIGRCITEVKLKVVEQRDREGNVTSTTQTFSIKLMSKDNLINLAAKHLGLIDSKGNAIPGAEPGTDSLVNKMLLNTLLQQVESRNNVLDAPSTEV